MVISLYLTEIKYRIVYSLYGGLLCFLIGYSYAKECFYLLAEPYCVLWGNGFFLLINIFEILFGYLKLSFVAGFLYFVIMLVLNIWLFLIGGIYQVYNKLIVKYCIAFLLGSVLFIYVIYTGILPLVFSYMIKLSDFSSMWELSFDMEPRMLNYIDLSIKLITVLYFLLVAPILIMWVCFYLLSDIMEVLSYRAWYYFLLLVMIISFLPPDMLLHSMVFCIMVMCSEFCILVVTLVKSYDNRLRR